MQISSCQRRGFTLVELLLFTAIISIMAGALIGFSLVSTNLAVRDEIVSEVEQNGDVVLQRIIRTVSEQADVISNPENLMTDDKLVLFQYNPEHTYEFYLHRGRVAYLEDGVLSYLTNDAIKIENLRFLHFGSEREGRGVSVVFLAGNRRIGTEVAEGQYSRVFRGTAKLNPRNECATDDQCPQGPPSEVCCAGRCRASCTCDANADCSSPQVCCQDAAGDMDCRDIANCRCENVADCAPIHLQSSCSVGCHVEKAVCDAGVCTTEEITPAVACPACTSCGDGIEDPLNDEECDDGDGDENDSCPADCKDAECGDGYLWDTDGGAEECDDGNREDGDGCSSTCLHENLCEGGVADGTQEGDEECDGGACVPAPENTSVLCTDGLDNDCDDLKDSLDSDCDCVTVFGGQCCSDACDAGGPGSGYDSCGGTDTCCATGCAVPSTCGNGSIDAGEECGEPSLSCGGGDMCDTNTCVCESVPGCWECENSGCYASQQRWILTVAGVGDGICGGEFACSDLNGTHTLYQVGAGYCESVDCGYCWIGAAGDVCESGGTGDHRWSLYFDYPESTWMLRANYLDGSHHAAYLYRLQGASLDCDGDNTFVIDSTTYGLTTTDCSSWPATISIAPDGTDLQVCGDFAEEVSGENTCFDAMNNDGDFSNNVDCNDASCEGKICDVVTGDTCIGNTCGNGPVGCYIPPSAGTDVIATVTSSCAELDGTTFELNFDESQNTLITNGLSGPSTNGAGVSQNVCVAAGTQMTADLECRFNTWSFAMFFSSLGDQGACYGLGSVKFVQTGGTRSPWSQTWVADYSDATGSSGCSCCNGNPSITVTLTTP